MGSVEPSRYRLLAQRKNVTLKGVRVRGDKGKTVEVFSVSVRRKMEILNT